MNAEEQGKLKHEISKRWPKVREDVIAHAQLEYILTEAGLLPRGTRKRKTKSKINEQKDLIPQ